MFEELRKMNVSRRRLLVVKVLECNNRKGIKQCKKQVVYKQLWAKEREVTTKFFPKGQFVIEEKQVPQIFYAQKMAHFEKKKRNDSGSPSFFFFLFYFAGGTVHVMCDWTQKIDEFFSIQHEDIKNLDDLDM